MRQSGRCSKCGSINIIPDVRVMGRVEGSHQDVDLRVDANPAALFFNKATYTTLHACVCGACGFTEFYAAEPAVLMEAWRESQKG